MTWGRDTDEHEARDQFEAFVEAGGTLVDTAASYGDGASERVLGAMLGTVVPRSDVVIATKAGVTSTAGWPALDTSRRSLLDQLDDSLDRLGLDHVDLWYVQGHTPHVPLDETLSALDDAVASGRTRYAGVSNFGGWQTGWAAAHQAAAPTRTRIVANQVEYSLVQRGVEREVVACAAESGIGVVAWAPLGRGVLTGKYRSGTPADSRAASPHFADYVETHLTEWAAQIVAAVCTAADGLGAQPLEVALAWVRDRPGVSSVITGARNAAQLRGILKAEELILPTEILDVLDEVSAPLLDYPEQYDDPR